MPTIDLPHGTVQYRLAGPPDAAPPPVVFVHGFLVSATLWSATADALAAAGVRSYAPDLPLGSHTIPLGGAADQSPRGIARQVIAFMQALELEDVTLVGNDTGGAICQFLLDADDSLIGRVVLTNCDTFTSFPPAPFGPLIKACRSPQQSARCWRRCAGRPSGTRPPGSGCSSTGPSTPASRAPGWNRACATRPSARTLRASQGRWTPRT